MSFQTDVSLGLRTSAIVFIFYYLYVYLGLTCRHNLVLFKLALITARKNLIKLEDVCVLLLLLRIQVYMHHVGPWQEVGAALHLELGNNDMSQPLALDPLVLTH